MPQCVEAPIIANERLKRNRIGKVVLGLKSAFKDGTAHIVIAPLEFNAAPGRNGAAYALTSDPLPWRADAEREVPS